MNLRSIWLIDLAKMKVFFLYKFFNFLDNGKYFICLTKL